MIHLLSILENYHIERIIVHAGYLLSTSMTVCLLLQGSAYGTLTNCRRMVSFESTSNNWQWTNGNNYTNVRNSIDVWLCNVLRLCWPAKNLEEKEYISVFLPFEFVVLESFISGKCLDVCCSTRYVFIWFWVQCRSSLVVQDKAWSCTLSDYWQVIMITALLFGEEIPASLEFRIRLKPQHIEPSVDGSLRVVAKK